MNTKEKYNTHVMRTYSRTEAVLEYGTGTSAYGEDGKEYIDFGSGIGTNSLGYCDSDWAEAVSAQARKLQHTSNYYYTEAGANFAEKLCGLTGYTNLFFGNSGAEANECAIKIARKYSFDKYGKGRHNIVTFTNSFHGRTLATLSATGQDSFHNYFFPFPDGFRYAEAGNLESLKQQLDDTVCAVMFEYVQGEGGVIGFEKSFVDGIFSLCAEKDILTISDEVQTGTGRTGKFLAGEHFGKKADLCTLAKGLAGGLPIGVCLAGEKCSEVLTPGTHGSTFGGNPVVCAGGLKVLEKIGGSSFLDEVTRKGEIIRKRLSAIPEVEEISGIGLMIGVKLKTFDAHDVMDRCIEKGLLTLTAKEKLRLLPPLTISYEQIEKGLDILESMLTKGLDIT